MSNLSNRIEADSGSTSSNLLRRVTERDAEAWRQLVQLYGPLVVRWCLRRNLQDADAADVAQEVFQIVARKIGDFRRDAAGNTFQGWLRVVTDHAIVDRWRRERRQPQGTGDSDHQRLLAEVAAESSVASVSGEDLRQDAQLVRLKALELLRQEFDPRAWQAFWRTTADGPSEPLKLGWLGKYELLGRLGQGSMGTVYLARQARLDRRVALKVLSPSRISDKNSLTRFESEMKAVGKLEHPNIVRAYDADEAEGVHFLVMEAVAGCDLAQLMKRRGNPLPVAEACDIIRQAANGLHHAHQHGLVHRDIKPSNLILTMTGEVKVLDLGLAVLQPGIRTGDELTEESQLVGTPEYIAPEQAIDSHAIGPRADIYSLGVTFYKLLTGRTPYGEGRRDKPLRMIMAHLNARPVDIRTLRNDIPAPVAEIVSRMLAKTPEQRFATAAEVSQLLAPWAAGSRPASLLEGELQAAERQPSGTLSFEQPTTDFGDTVERQSKSDQLSAPPAVDSDAEKRVPLTAPAKIPPWHRRPVMVGAMAAGFLILL